MDNVVLQLNQIPLPKPALSALKYPDMYSPVNPAWLIAAFGESFTETEILEAETRYTVQKVINHLPEITHCVSVSFFCKNSDSRIDRPLPIPSAKVDSAWHKRYYQSFKAFLDDFHKIPFFQNWKVRVYIEPDIVELIPSLMGERIEFFIMAENSFGASPGALWRFLAFGDKALDVVHVTDIDEFIKDKTKIIKAFLSDESKVFGRLIHKHSRQSFFVEGHTVAKNYAPIMAGRFACRPKLFHFDIAKAMQAWVRMRMRAINTGKPWQVTPTDKPSLYNAVPLSGNHPYGWGNHYHGYSFVERFLKHVVYPYAVTNGVLQTWISYDWREEPQLSEEILADLCYLAEYEGNSLVFLEPKK